MPGENILYKYRSVTDRVLGALELQVEWFSSRYRLNDLYDGHVRLAKAIMRDDVEYVSSISRGRSFKPAEILGDKLLARIEAESDPFERLGMMAEYAEDGDLLRLLERPTVGPVDLLWFGAYGAVGHFLDATAIFCVSASPYVEPLWGNYADSYRGFCIGYRRRSDHPLLDRLRPVRYTADLLPVTLSAALSDPVQVRDHFLYTKSDGWKHEQEWRVTVTGSAGLRQSPLEVAEVVFGAAMPPEHRARVRSKLADGASVRFFELRKAFRRGFQLSMTECEEPA